MAADRIMFCWVLLLWIGYHGLIELRGLLAHLEALVNSKIINPSLIRFFFIQHASASSRELLQLWRSFAAIFGVSLLAVHAA